MVLGASRLAMKNWLSGLENFACRCKDCIFSWVFDESEGGFRSGTMFFVAKRVAFYLLSFIMVLGGATIGTVTGAIKGQTTETGLLRGAGVGVLAGVIMAVQLLELMANGEPFSKVALIRSLVNGKIFMEWVSPAVLKAYQWQISSIVETNLREISDIFYVNVRRGLSHDTINKLPIYRFPSGEPTNSIQEISCAICLVDFKNGDFTRCLPSCTHWFHSHCIDEWLNRNGNCPICRTDVMPASGYMA